MKTTLFSLLLVISFAGLFGQTVLDTDHKHFLELITNNGLITPDAESSLSLYYKYRLTPSLNGRFGVSYLRYDTFGTQILQTEEDIFRRDSSEIKGAAVSIGLERERPIGKKVSWYFGGDLSFGYKQGDRRQKRFREAGGSLNLLSDRTMDLRQYDAGIFTFIGLKFYTCNWLGFSAQTGINTIFRSEEDLTGGLQTFSFNQDVFQQQIGIFVRL